MNPIEAGKLPDGSPDLYFRGFYYCWNSEVGTKTLGIASFYLRAVCQNRNLWGVEDCQETSIRHSKYAATRFAYGAAPALTCFADSLPRPFSEGIRAARERIVASRDDDRTDFLRKRGLSKAETAGIVETVLAEEGEGPPSPCSTSCRVSPPSPVRSLSRMSGPIWRARRRSFWSARPWLQPGLCLAGSSLPQEEEAGRVFRDGFGGRERGFDQPVAEN